MVTLYKAYRVTDGNDELHIAAESRSKASGAFIRYFGRGIDWKALRATRTPELDGDRDRAWSRASDDYDTASYWGAPVRMPQEDRTMVEQFDMFSPAGTVPCARCGVPCRVPPSSKPETMILRGGKAGKPGVCASCNFAAFLMDPSLPFFELMFGMEWKPGQPIPPLTDKARATLLAPQMQQTAIDLIRVQPGGADLPASLIDFQRIVDTWQLPHPPGTFGRRRSR